MKYSFLYLILTFYSCNNSAQIKEDQAAVISPPDTRTFSKYSYLVTGELVDIAHKPRIDFSSYNGTGFFYKKMDKLFFITAKHVVSGCWRNKKFAGFYQNSVYVWLEDGRKIPINVKLIVDSIKCLTPLDRPDVIAIPVNSNDFNFVLTIESLAQDTSFTPMNDLEVFGFGWQVVPIDKIKNPYDQIKNIHLAGATYVINTQFDQETKEIDPFNLWVYSSEIKIDSTLSGFSGSPVIAQDSASNKWKLLGVFCSHQENVNSAERAIGYVKIKYMLEDIDKYFLVPQK